MRTNRWNFLTDAMRGGGRWLVVAMVLGAFVATGHAQVIFTDTFDEGTGDWYTAGSSGTLTTNDGELSWTPGAGGMPAVIGRSFPTQTLENVGDKIRLTFDYRQTGGSVGIFRTGLHGVETPISADNWAGGNNIGVWAGYFTFVRDDSTSGNRARRDNGSSTSNTAGPTHGGTDIGSNATRYNINTDGTVTYQVMFEVERTETGIDTLFTMSDGTSSFSLAGSTTTAYTDFNTAVIRTDTAGRTGFFDNIKVEVIGPVSMSVFDGEALVEPSSTIDLGLLLPDESATLPLTVANAASASENLELTNSPNAVVFSNGSTSQNGFTISQNITGADTTIEPGESSSFTISFPPNDVGTYSATVHIANNDTAKNPYEFTITAQVVDAPVPDMSVLDGATLVEPSSTLDLGSVQPDEIVTKTLTVANASVALANLLLTNEPDAVVFSNGSTSQNGFTISQNITGADTTIEPGESSSFTVEFASSSVGSRSATISIANNDPDKDPYTFTVTAVVLTTPITIAEFLFTDGSMASSDDEPLTTVSNITFGAGIDGTLTDAVAGVVNNRLVINSIATTVNSSSTSESGQLGNALANDMYFTFTVMIPRGVEVDLTGLSFDYELVDPFRFGMGVFSDKTGFTYDNRLYGFYSSSAQTINPSIDLSSSAELQDLTDTTVEFRVYVSDGSGISSREHIFDDVVLEGRARMTIFPGTVLIIK